MIRKFYFTLAAITAASFSIVSAQQTAKVTASGIGYLEYLPQGYHSSSNKYPVVISLHGIKEKGTSSTDRQRVLADLPRVDNVGLPKYVKSGKQYPFILISPQLKSKHGTWPPSYVIEVLNYVKKHLRIDEKRIYLTGLSLGGYGVWKTAAEYPEVFAAIAPVCPGGNAINKASAIAAKNLPAWGFHGGSDKIVSYTVTTKMINAMNSAPKKPNPLAKATIFPGMGHVIWDKAYNQTNLLDWMLSHRKGSAPSNESSDDDSEKDDDEGDKESNKGPEVKAGPDKTLTLPANSLYITGNANDPDGKIVSYKWTKISGGYASLSHTSASRMRASNLKKGRYVFRLTAKDNDGAVRSDQMTVVVKGTASNNNDDNRKPEKKTSSKNSLPVVSAGPDRVITLPSNTISIQGKASDKDGKIVSYDWAKTYGRRADISGGNSSRVRISNLERGVYIFRLRAKDNDGGVKDDYFKITVNGSKAGAPKRKENTSTGNKSGSSNAIPYADAGPDRVLTLPTNSVSITARASDKDGRIVSYQWTKTYGNRATLSDVRSPRVRISNLSPGVYIFRLTVKDNDGGAKHDYFKITVKRSSSDNRVSHRSGRTSSEANMAPVAHAGPDRKVSLAKRTITLKGSGYDRDGKVVSYRWKKLSGPAITINNARSPEPTITDLRKGHYYFSLLVEDDDHARSVDKMALRVTGS